MQCFAFTQLTLPPLSPTPHPATHAQYKEFVESRTDIPPTLAVTPDTLAAAQAARAALQQQSEAQAAAAVARFAQYSEAVRASTQLRVQAMLDGALADAQQAAEVWKQREAYAKFAVSQNESLRWVLDRAAAAIQKCVIEEDPAAAAAAAKGAKKK